MAATRESKVVARRSGKLTPSMPTLKVTPNVGIQAISSRKENPGSPGLKCSQRIPEMMNNNAVHMMAKTLTAFWLTPPMAKDSREPNSDRIMSHIRGEVHGNTAKKLVNDDNHGNNSFTTRFEPE
jgi:hypothetical protein